MSNHNQEPQAAITEGDGLIRIIVASNFILLSTSMVGEDDAERWALTAEMGNMQVLVAFTDELTAKAFVDKMADFTRKMSW